VSGLRPRIAVLGGGLTGVATALELAANRVSCLLIEQDERLLNRAALRNEGKIHLGLIYANEGSLDTARLQLEGALSFRQHLGRWLGPSAERIPVSTPFVYLVDRTSLLTEDDLRKHYEAVDDLYRARLSQDYALDYLGERPDRLFRELDAIPSQFDARRFIAAYETAERAIDTEVMTAHLRDAVSNQPFIQVKSGVEVKGVSQAGDRLEVEGWDGTQVWRHQFDQVVNALWDGRIPIDNSYGMPVPPGWVHRLKYRTIVRLPERLADAPSATLVLGRYGDVVVRHDRTAYLSWYPAGMRGWSHDERPPADWEAACTGAVPLDVAHEIASDTLHEIDAWYPGIGLSDVLVVDAEVIVGYGRTDVDDRASGLHSRSRVGIRSRGGYHSVDPGKLTTAPLFAARVVETVLTHVGHGASPAA